MHELDATGTPENERINNFFESPSAELCPSVAIVVLNWNGLDDTVACVRSLLHVSYRRFQIIIVDNGSTDGSPDKIAQMFPQLVLLRRPTNGGYAAGTTRESAMV